MNWSAGTTAEVPPGVVTVTSARPAEPAGEVATQVVVDEQDTAVAPAPANLTVVETVPVRKPVPVMEIPVPPARGPEDGAMAVTAGAAR